MEDQSLLTLKPNILNALVPTFVRNLFYSSIIVLILFGLSILLERLDIITIPNKLLWLLLLLLILAIIPLLAKIIVLSNTTYYFFKTHISREFELLMVRKHSVPYSQIINISIDISLWDRLCNAGDIILHTAEDKAPNLVLHYIKDPEKLEKQIYRLVRVTKAPSQR